MTPRELAGWVPAETHTHYAADGETVTGYTVVERESRIDDGDRADLLALSLYEQQLCKCGFHPSIANDPDNDFQPVDVVCPVCAGSDGWVRVLQERDEPVMKAMKDAPAQQPRPWDGRHSYVQQLTPQQAAEATKKGGDRGDKARARSPRA